MVELRGQHNEYHTPTVDSSEFMSHFNFILYRSFGPKPQAFPSPRNKHLYKRSLYVCMHLYVCFLGGHGNPLQYSCL